MHIALTKHGLIVLSGENFVLSLTFFAKYAIIMIHFLKIKELKRMRKITKSLTSSVLALTMLTAAMMPAGISAEEDAGLIDTVITADAKDTAAQAPDRVEVTDYSSTAKTVTLTWKKLKGVKGYRIYQLKNGKYEKVLTTAKNKNTATVKGLTPAKRYTFKVRAYVMDNGKNVWGKKSKAINTATAPSSKKSAYAVTGVRSAADDSSVTVSWGKVSCTGYAVYLYNDIDEKWVRVAKIDGKNNTSITLDRYTTYKGGKDCVGNISRGAQFGYRFAVRPYKRDADGRHTLYAKKSAMKDPYYNISTLKNIYNDEYTLLAKMLPKAKSSSAPSTYNTYITTKDKKGNISSTKYTSYVSDASRDAYKDFAKKHFGKSWSDAEKILYTVNWINKNNVYDRDYVANAGGYFANVTVQKLGQCNSYNGAIAEMLTILGYKGQYLQCMDPTVREWQHCRCEIKIGKKTYSFESGEPGWMWVFREYDEVPLSKKAK